ncbi:hypothetical protein NPIL_441711 [Nephila pilipes]|uniref:Uncharacterized protein n=1 Tax=Nephila pilipes TaxID=299642 RepID=A0A8X6N0I4_NEPPI|nr:hypothetical protein NPIL_441711 [Nephila pilipes]
MATSSKAKAKISHPKRLENENRTFGKSNLLAQEGKTKMAADGIIFLNITHSDRYSFFCRAHLKSFCPAGRKLGKILDDFIPKSCGFVLASEEGKLSSTVHVTKVGQAN